MLACRGGLARPGPNSPESGRAFEVARREGDAPGCNPVPLSGEPIGPNGLESDPSLARCAKNPPNRDGDACEGEPTLLAPSFGVPSPLSEPDSMGLPPSSAFLLNLRAFSAGVSRSCKELGTISSSNAKLSSQSSSLLDSSGGRAPTLAESMRVVFRE
jgi:hypothetical protein